MNDFRGHAAGQHDSPRGHLTGVLLASAALTVGAVAAGMPSNDRLREQSTASGQAGEFERWASLLTEVDERTNLRIMLGSLSGEQSSGSGGIAGSGGAAQGCEVTKTHSDQPMEGENVPVVLQLGFVETEIAAATFSVAPEDFPLILNVAEMLFGQDQTTVTTTTEWSLMIWEGTPAAGSLIEVISSDDIILPHLVMPPGTQATSVQVVVDPTDPDQIVIQNNGSNSFSVGFRIDKHNNPPTSSCFFGCVPAVCCPPQEHSNAFPTTDSTTYPGPPNNPAQNWLFARACPGACPGFVAPPGWYNFNQLASLGYQPSGAWNIRVTYTPVNAQQFTGGCCLPSSMGGGCQVMSNCECESVGGAFVGPGTTCTGAGCPVAGACCFPPSLCTDGSFEAECIASNGTFAGPGSSCAQGACTTPVGACCVPATGQCVGGVTQSDCTDGAGIWQGSGSSCAAIVCFPEGACCLPDGSCVGPVSPEDCDAADGTFQGNDTQCGSISCPQPVGACCLPNGNCIVQNSANCAGFGGEWMGIGTDCTDRAGTGTADACKDPAECRADLTGSGTVNVFDLLELLGVWGPCSAPCPADLDNNGVVNVFDLLALLGAWGPCP